MMMRGAQLDSKTLEELAGIAQSTALNIISTIRLALTMTAEPNGFETALSRAFIPTFKKRSRKTPADGRPWEEENEFESSECASSAPERVEKSESTLANETHLSLHLNQHEQFIYSLLSSEPVHFDSLCEQSGRPPGEVSAALMMLELEGLCRSTSFNCFARIQNCAQLAAATDVRGPLPECITDAVEAASAFINLYHRGISRKYVQLYLMDHAYQTTKSIKTKIRWIIGACWRAGPIGHPDLLRYVSPRTVEFAALPKSTREAAI